MKANFKQILKNTWLCIKYPFLYPRNRFTSEIKSWLSGFYKQNNIK